MELKYNIYLATSANGPWELINPNPISDNLNSVNNYTISGLPEGIVYYIKIIGGTIIDNVFVPLVKQSIGDKSAGGIGITDPAIAPFVVMHKSPI